MSRHWSRVRVRFDAFSPTAEVAVEGGDLVTCNYVGVGLKGSGSA